ncbi:hypothetical protein [Pedobacter sp. MW01-1-1]|uniref:hypothetical protein n=1 Tax=Pedobacter sp. MW01-1-1 TaxID=3383027 RepID=UPI003FEF17ED
MKFKTFLPLFTMVILASCKQNPFYKNELSIQLKGTWQLVSATSIENGKSTVTDYTKGQKMIKIINDTHFAFLSHKVDVVKDSSNLFNAGGGSYTLKGDEYTEHLDFFKDRNWEGQTFVFKINIQKDTLLQTGVEKVKAAGVDHTIIEKYVRVKSQ